LITQKDSDVIAVEHWHCCVMIVQKLTLMVGLWALLSSPWTPLLTLTSLMVL